MIMITGGGGFIGSVLLWALNQVGEEDIVVVDRLGAEDKWLNLRGAKFSEYIYADELFTPKYAEIFGKLRFILHMGACSSTTEKNADYLMENNFQYSQKLFALAAMHGVKMIYASSAATYGDGRWGYSDELAVVDKLRPLNPYGFSKHLFDLWALKQIQVPPLWLGLKFFNVYGPHEYHKEGMRSVVFQACQQLMSGNKESSAGVVRLFKSYLPEYADGEQLRDFVYVKDVAQCILKMMKLGDGKVSGVYNLGTGKARSFNDLALSVANAMGKELVIQYIDMPDGLRDQYQYKTQADTQRLSQLLPGHTFCSLEEGIQDYIQKHLLPSPSYL